MKPVLRKTVVDEIVSSVMDAVETGEMRPGDRFPSERALAEQWSVSRASVREAMKALSFANIILIKPGDGTYVAPTSPNTAKKKMQKKIVSICNVKDMEQRVEARVALEIQIVRLAAVRMTPKSLVPIEKMIGEIEKSCAQKNVKTLLEADYKFHQAVAAAAQNRYLQEAYDHVLLAGPEWFGITRLPFEHRVAYSHNHQDILDALKTGDPDLAEEMVRRHEVSVWERYRSYYRSPEDPGAPK